MMLRNLILAVIFLSVAIFSKIYQGPYQSQIDAYLGDVGVVGFLYFILSIFSPKQRPMWKALIIALVATAVEMFQLTGIPRTLELPVPFVFVLGTSFDPYDFGCYFVGILLALMIDQKLLLSKNA